MTFRSDRPSLAVNLFTRITTDSPVPYLRSMVESMPRAVENEWTEFKAFPWADFKDPSASCEPPNLNDRKRDMIKETWSRTISAFANTEGGVLIWGIHAAKREGVDEAQSFQLVPNPSALASRLSALHHEATDPPLPGVRVEAFSDPAETGKGFVVCYIPQGESVPYRAEQASKSKRDATSDGRSANWRLASQSVPALHAANNSISRDWWERTLEVRWTSSETKEGRWTHDPRDRSERRDSSS